MSDKDPSLMARCPECDSRIYFERRPDTGQMIVCPECETSLEVIGAYPIRLDWADEEGGRGGAGDFDPEAFFGRGFGDEDENDEDTYQDDEDDGDY